MAIRMSGLGSASTDGPPVAGTRPRRLDVGVLAFPGVTVFVVTVFVVRVGRVRQVTAFVGGLMILIDGMTAGIGNNLLYEAR